MAAHLVQIHNLLAQTSPTAANALKATTAIQAAWVQHAPRARLPHSAQVPVLTLVKAVLHPRLNSENTHSLERVIKKD